MAEMCLMGFVVFFALWAIEKVLHRLDRARWEEREAALLDRIQAREPQVLERLIAREYATSEMARAAEREPEVESSQPPQEQEMPGMASLPPMDHELREALRIARAGEATYL